MTPNIDILLYNYGKMIKLCKFNIDMLPLSNI